MTPEEAADFLQSLLRPDRLLIRHGEVLLTRGIAPDRLIVEVNPALLARLARASSGSILNHPGGPRLSHRLVGSVLSVPLPGRGLVYADRLVRAGAFRKEQLQEAELFARRYAEGLEPQLEPSRQDPRHLLEWL